MSSSCHRQEHADLPKRSWYSQSFSEDEEAPSSLVPPEAETCDGASGEGDACSDASTDVGEDENTDDEAEIPVAAQDTESVKVRPSFLKVGKDQRMEQLKRVVQEFCSLDFNSVDPAAQEALVMRKLTLLKSLEDSATYYSDDARSEQTRLALPGLDPDAHVLHEITLDAQRLCEHRRFRSAFETLQGAAPLLCRALPTTEQLCVEGEDAMKLRRLQRKTRQREQRRAQRQFERAERSAQRLNDTHQKKQQALQSRRGMMNSGEFQG